MSCRIRILCFHESNLDSQFSLGYGSGQSKLLHIFVWSAMGSTSLSGLLWDPRTNFRGGGSPLTLSWTQHFTFIEVTNIILPCMYTYIWIHFRIRTAVRCLNGGKLRRLLKLKTGVCCPPTPPCVGQSGFKQSFKRINSSPPKLVRQAKF